MVPSLNEYKEKRGKEEWENIGQYMYRLLAAVYVERTRLENEPSGEIQ